MSEAYEQWMIQVLRNLTDAVNGFLLGKTHLIMDRDPIFTIRVRELLKHAGTNPVRLPRRSPNLNAFIERLHPLDQGGMPRPRHPAG